MKIILLVFGVLISSLLSTLAYVGVGALSEIKIMNKAQAEHLIEFATVNNEVLHIKEDMSEIKTTVQSLNRRSYTYWPESSHRGD